MKKPPVLIVLIDLLENSSVLAEYAFEFSKKWKCKTIFVHHLVSASPALSDEESKRHILNYQINDSLTRLKTVVSEKTLFLNASFEVIVTKIVPWLQQLNHNRYEYYVLTGMKEAGILKQFFIGSTPNKIVEHTDLPVFAFPYQVKKPIPHKIAIGLQCEYRFNKVKCIDMLQKLQDNTTEVTLFSILSTEENEPNALSYLQEIALMLSAFKPKIKMMKDDDIREGINDFLRKDNDMLLMLQQGPRNIKDKFSRKFLINKIVFDGKIPLAIIPY